MSRRSEVIREQIATSDLATGQSYMRRVIRYAARRRLYLYAERNFIVDFDDAQLVEQSHRDYRQSVIDFASNRATEVNAAVTVDELLAIFDLISQHI